MFNFNIKFDDFIECPFLLKNVCDMELDDFLIFRAINKKNINKIKALGIKGGRLLSNVCLDARGSISFLHSEGFYGDLVGWETLKGNTTSYKSIYGKGLWVSHNSQIFSPDYVIAESALDALSYATLYPDDKTEYVSTSGNLSPNQLGELFFRFGHLKKGSVVTFAINNDAEDIEDWDYIVTMLSCAFSHVKFILHLPASGESWTTELKRQRALSSEEKSSPDYQNPARALVPVGNRNLIRQNRLKRALITMRTALKALLRLLSFRSSVRARGW